MGSLSSAKGKVFCYPVDAQKRNSYKIYRLQWQFLEDETTCPEAKMIQQLDHIIAMVSMACNHMYTYGLEDT